MLYLWNTFNFLSTSYPQFKNTYVEKKGVLPVWKNACKNLCKRLAQCNFTAFVDCKNRTTAWTSETTGFCCTKLFVADRAGNNQRKRWCCSRAVSRIEVRNCFFYSIFNIKERRCSSSGNSAKSIWGFPASWILSVL